MTIVLILWTQTVKNSENNNVGLNKYFKLVDDNVDTEVVMNGNNGKQCFCFLGTVLFINSNSESV